MSTGRVARLTAAAGTLALAATLTACSGNGSSAHLPGDNPNQQHAADTVTATRWWSTPISAAGSLIDSANPSAGATGLTASRADYCLVLRQTVAHGGSALAGASATDPAVLTTTQAFVAETSALAPPRVAPAWKTFGGALVAIAGSKGNLANVHGVDSKAVAAATKVISADATQFCHVDLATK